MRRLTYLAAAAALLVLSSYLSACSGNDTGPGGSGGGGTSSSTTSTATSGSGGTMTTSSTGTGGGIAHPCALPGSVRFLGGVKTIVPGGVGANELDFLKLPSGFCAHYFATVGNARQLREAPGGEIFVASPTTSTTGGGPGGQAAIVVLPDDDGDGVADKPVTFLGNLPSTQGLAFTPDGFFYYQDGTRIMKLAYKAGDRMPSATPQQVANITYYSSSLHWPKPIDIADDGSIYVGNGGDQGEMCTGLPHPFHGGIRELDGTDDGAGIAQGLRNPIAIRCLHGKGVCFALELAKDYSAEEGGREKLIPIRKGDDWGFPCCATKDLPYTDVPQTDCSTVVPEIVGFIIGNTPFGLAFAPASWPAPWSSNAIVASHGAAGSWVGARIVGIGMDANGMPLPGGNINGQDTGSLQEFASGWDDGTLKHGRPAAVELTGDGRLFVSNDNNGVIFWVAPID